MTEKFSEFIEYQKFSYRIISKPDQTISEMFKNTYYLFSNKDQKSSYFRDINFLITCIEYDPNRRIKLNRIYKLYKFSDIAIVGYAIHSLYWHYKNKFFTGAKFLEAYIIGKILLNVCLFSFGAFFVLKNRTDSTMYDYFKVKEDEWDKNFEKRSAEITFMRDRKKALDISRTDK